jgi:chromosome partitioning protein
MIILIGGEKGGCGKTTTAVHMAAEFANRGFKTALLDSDNKKSAKNWSVARSSLTHYLATGESDGYLTSEDVDNIPNAALKKLKKLKNINSIECIHAVGEIIDIIEAMASRSEILIMDIGGGDTQEFHIGLAMSDMIICPFKTSVLDVETIPKLKINLKLAKSKNPGLIIKTLVSEAPTNAFSDDIADLKRLFGNEAPLDNVFSTPVKCRTAYKRSIEYGLGVVEWSDPKAKGEMSVLVEDVIKELGIKREVA